MKQFDKSSLIRVFSSGQLSSIPSSSEEAENCSPWSSDKLKGCVLLHDGRWCSTDGLLEQVPLYKSIFLPQTWLECVQGRFRGVQANFFSHRLCLRSISALSVSKGLSIRITHSWQHPWAEYVSQPCVWVQPHRAIPAFFAVDRQQIPLFAWPDTSPGHHWVLCLSCCHRPVMWCPPCSEPWGAAVTSQAWTAACSLCLTSGLHWALLCWWTK